MSERRARPASKNPMKSVWRRALTPPQPPEPPAPAAPAPFSAADSTEVASVVEAALYQDGVRVSSPATLAETFRELRDQPSGMAWIGLARPTEAEL
ncbi:transporter, partial [Streptomyces sp. NPDC006356]